MTVGRPVGSPIRQNIVEILYFMKKGYGYQISKAYAELFSKATQRVIYYHLKKGVETGEFMVEKIKKEEGEYSWGAVAEKTYYKLGPGASPKMLIEVKRYFDRKKRVSKKKFK